MTTSPSGTSWRITSGSGGLSSSRTGEFLIEGLEAGPHRLVERLLTLFGGAASTAETTTPRGVIVGAQHLARLSAQELEGLQHRAGAAPWFLVPADAAGGDELERALQQRLPELNVTLGPASEVRRFRFAASRSVWPFSEVVLEEAQARLLRPVTNRPPASEPLVSSDNGDIFVRVSGEGNDWFISTVALPDGSSWPLSQEFAPTRFMSLFPFLHFARHALGDRAWQGPPARAALMIDDPNLRRGRYGFIDYQRLTQAAVERNFHVSVGMIPIDYRKTSPEMAAFARENARWLSLVIHGVDHLYHEFEAEVTPDEAQQTLAQGLARMAAHEQATGVEHARAMTFPHGRCNLVWLAAMRRVGLDAAIRRAFPFSEEQVEFGMLHEMLPAETSFHSFPVLNRFNAAEGKERLLFQAWLKKPLIVYSHHDFFREGLDLTFEITDYLNRHVHPSWESIASIVAGNYQVRATAGGTALRAFSNRIRLPDDNPVTVLKPAAEVPEDESAWIDGSAVPADHLPGAGVMVSWPGGRTGAELVFGPAPQARPASLRPRRLKSLLRRAATEIRDQAGIPTPRVPVDIDGLKAVTGDSRPRRV
jgi:hypothetical protein